MGGLRAGIDLRYLSIEIENRGISKYIYNLISEFDKMDLKHETFYYPAKNVQLNLKSRKSYVKQVNTISVFKKCYSWGGRLLLGSSLKKDKINLVHFPEMRGFWPTRNIKSVVTIYDIIPFLFENEYRKVRHIEYFPSYSYHLKKIKKADCLIAISETTKNDIVKYLDINPNKIEVTLLGVKDIFKKTERFGDDETLRKYNLTNLKYLMVVGGFDFRKNIPFLLRVFNTLRRRLPIKLVLVGYIKNDLKQLLVENVEQVSFRDDVIFTGYIPDKELVSLLNHSNALVFSSIYEGFGLPIAEAIMCDVPVIAYGSSAAMELMGDSPGLIKNLYEKEFVNILEKVIEEKEFNEDILKWQEGRKSLFSWEKTAINTIDIYNKIAG
jgi:hypothetical protein